MRWEKKPRSPENRRAARMPRGVTGGCETRSTRAAFERPRSKAERRSRHSQHNHHQKDFRDDVFQQVLHDSDQFNLIIGGLEIQQMLPAASFSLPDD